MHSRAILLMACLALDGLDSGAWATNTSAQSPIQGAVRAGPPLPAAPRLLHQAVWDGASERAYVFGGIDSAFQARGRALDEVWSFHPGSGTWTRIPTSTGPAGRFAFGMTWDSKRSRLLVLGGNAGRTGNCRIDLWALDPELGSWTSLNGERPYQAGRSHHGLTYDPANDRAWQTFGACGGFPFRGYDGYRADTDDWVGYRLAPVEMGPPRHQHMAAWDFKRRRLLVAGGGSSGYGYSSPAEAEVYRFVWSIDPTTGWWEKLPAGPELAPWRVQAIAGYDPYLDALLVYGGTNRFYPGTLPSYVSNELWAYLLGPRRWSRIQLEGLPRRTEAAGVYSPASGEMFVFGGADTTFIPNRRSFSDTWIIPIEVPARFAWSPAAARERSQGTVRWGELDVPEVDQPIDNVRLMDCESGEVIETSERVMKVGRGRWKIGFGRETPDGARARSRGKLVVAGTFADGARAFLARLAENVRTLPPGHSVHEMDHGPETIPDESLMTLRRDGAGWRIRLTATLGRTDRVEIVDVAGRVRASIAASTLSAGEERRVIRWNGTDSSGQRLPHGIYFVRIPGRPEIRAARVVIVD